MSSNGQNGSNITQSPVESGNTVMDTVAAIRAGGNIGSHHFSCPGLHLPYTHLLSLYFLSAYNVSASSVLHCTAAVNSIRNSRLIPHS